MNLFFSPDGALSDRQDAYHHGGPDLFANSNQHGIVVRAAKRIDLVKRLRIVFLVVVQETRFVGIDMPGRNSGDVAS